MEEMYIWVKDIFLIIISLSFFEVLIPNSKMDKYIKFIFSLIILAVILEPLTSILSIR